MVPIANCGSRKDINSKPVAVSLAFAASVMRLETLSLSTLRELEELRCNCRRAQRSSTAAGTWVKSRALYMAFRMSRTSTLAEKP